MVLRSSLKFCTWLGFFLAIVGIEQTCESLFHRYAAVQERHQVLSRLAAVRARLEGLIFANLYRARGLAAVIALHPDLDQETFARIARTLVEDNSSLRNLAAAPDLVIRLIYPLAGNEAALGLDYRHSPTQRAAALRARDTGQPILAGPLPLVQGGVGVLVREPVFVETAAGERRFWGLVSAVMDAEAIYQRAGLRDPGLGLAIALRGTDGSGSEGPVFYGNAQLFAADAKAVTLEVSLPGGSWQMAAIPIGGWEEYTAAIWAIRFLGLIAGTASLAAILIAARQRRQQQTLDYLRSARLQLLEGLLADRPLPELLTHLARSLEAVRPNWRVSILKLEQGRLYTAAAPSLPDWYNAAVDGLEVKEGFGSCGTAAATGRMVIVEDVFHHPYWTAYLELARKAGFRACWSVPFTNSRTEVLGTFAVYYDRALRPRQEEIALIEEFAHLAALAMERTAAEARLRQAAAVFEFANEGIMITDLEPRIVAVNPAFCQITGYTEAEVVGRNPNLLRSGRQDKAFYRELWRCLSETGQWRGEIWNRRKNGEIYPQFLTISTVRDAEGQPTHYVALMHDLTLLKQSQERLEYLTHYDLLTGLPNRLLLNLSLSQALERATRQGQQVAALIFDLDRFNLINDSLSHAAGDELLAVLVERLQSHVRGQDLLGRLAGDEFLLIAENLPNPEAAARIAEHLLGALSQPFVVAGHSVYLSASIGISLYPDDSTTAAELIQHAQTAMRRAKQEERGSYRFYTPDLAIRAHRRLTLEARLRQALEMGHFLLHYQPLIELHSGKILGCEALVRWQDPEQGLIPPDQFIPLAEDSGLILPLGEWVLNTACTAARAWIEQGTGFKTVAVNLSARQFHQADLPQTIAKILSQTGLPPACLKLELTESMLMGEASAHLKALKALGVRLSLDDFGTGYSSLAYLKHFPLDEIKIDRSFIADFPEDSRAIKLIAAIVQIGRALDLHVVAEGVETQLQHEALLLQGCHAAQGYLYSRPLPENEFSALLLQPLKSCG
jgi:diguanylate cyclase (GGDEF)-like protein/PAS domain S-box-containing protein